MAYIVIEGVIGVGKTALTRTLGEQLGVQTFFEHFEENPFLGNFYADREQYAFQTEVFFLLNRYRQQESVVKPTLASAVDVIQGGNVPNAKFGSGNAELPGNGDQGSRTSDQGAGAGSIPNSTFHIPHSVDLVGDYLFAKTRLFAGLNLRAAELDLFDQIYEALALQLPSPELVVYLSASVDTLMARIYQRDRSFERGMQRGYIADLVRLYDSFFETYSGASLLRIDTNGLDFIRDSGAQQQVISAIQQAVYPAKRE